MKIAKLTIKGFRSFDPKGSSFDFDNNLSAFIGINSSGKTSALLALRKVFSTNPSDSGLKREDFYSKGNDDEVNNKELSIEAHIYFSESEHTIAQYWSHLVVDDIGDKPYLRIRLEATWSKSNVLDEGVIDAKNWIIRVPEGVEEADNKIGLSNHLKSQFQFIYIPAIRNPNEQLKYSSGTIFSRVLKKINWSEDFKSQFDLQMNSIGELFEGIPEYSAIKSSIKEYWKIFHRDSRYENASLNFGASDHEAILRNLEVTFDPSGIHRPYKVGDLGEGYRSLFYITLVCALLEVEEKLAVTNNEIGESGPLLTILAIEEPENHIAPQLLGRLINNLYKLSEKEKSQVFITSHTPAIIKRVKPESIYHFSIDIDDFKTVIKRIVLPEKDDEAFKYVKEAVYNYPEIYFAKVVVIGEGDSEEVVFNRIAKASELNFDDHIITFVPLGSRFVNHIWKLLDNLKIPHATLLDLDIGRDGGGWGRIKYALKQLLAINVPKEALLQIDGGVLSDDELEKMHTWTLDTHQSKASMVSWIKRLITYNIYFSKPLDLDFMLLSCFEQDYISKIPQNGGPRIPDAMNDNEKYFQKVEAAVHATLKSNEADDSFYKDHQKALMIYYNYLFLGRGKPSTHIATLSDISDEDLIQKLPVVLDQFFDKVKQLLGITNE